jgi:hypothetical protein
VLSEIAGEVEVLPSVFIYSPQRIWSTLEAVACNRSAEFAYFYVPDLPFLLSRVCPFALSRCYVASFSYVRVGHKSADSHSQETDNTCRNTTTSPASLSALDLGYGDIRIIWVPIAAEALSFSLIGFSFLLQQNSCPCKDR